MRNNGDWSVKDDRQILYELTDNVRQENRRFAIFLSYIFLSAGRNDDQGHVTSSETTTTTQAISSSFSEKGFTTKFTKLQKAQKDLFLLCFLCILSLCGFCGESCLLSCLFTYVKPAVKE